MCSRQKKISGLFRITIEIGILTFSVTAAVWQTEVVEPDLSHDERSNVDMVLDANDIPHIVYFNRAGNDDYLSLRYARLNGGEWRFVTIEENFLNLLWQKPKTLIAKDENDKLFVVYQRDAQALVYKEGVAEDWTAPQTIENARCLPHDAQVNSNGLLNVVYSHIPDGGDANDLVFWMQDEKSIVCSNGNFPSASLALDANNTPHVAYYDQVNDLLMYAVKDGNSWNNEDVEQVNDIDSCVWGSVALALDSKGTPHISYHSFVGEDLKYAVKSSGRWYSQAVETDGAVGRYNSIAVDSNDNVHICYQDLTNVPYALKYAKAVAAGWEIETVADCNEKGRYVSLALNSSNSPRIAFNIPPDYPHCHRILYAVGHICGDSDNPYPDGDADRNCFVDSFDFSRIAQHWLDSDCVAPDYCENTDLEQSGTVDCNDIFLLTNSWLECSMPFCY